MDNEPLFGMEFSYLTLYIDTEPYEVTPENFGLCPACRYRKVIEMRSCKACGGHGFVPRMRPWLLGKYAKPNAKGFEIVDECEKWQELPMPVPESAVLRRGK